MMKVVCASCIALGLGVGLAHAATPNCQATSSRMLDHLDQGDYAGATTDFDDTMKANLGADRLAKIWPALAERYGARGAREQGRLSQVNGYAVVLTALHYGPHLIDVRVVCDADGKVAGFFNKPLD